MKWIMPLIVTAVAMLVALEHGQAQPAFANPNGVPFTKAPRGLTNIPPGYTGTNWYPPNQFPPGYVPPPGYEPSQPVQVRPALPLPPATAPDYSSPAVIPSGRGLVNPLPAEQLPINTVPANQLPPNTLPAGQVPLNTVPARPNQPLDGVPPAGVPPNRTPRNNVPPNQLLPGQTIPNDPHFPRTAPTRTAQPNAPASPVAPARPASPSSAPGPAR